MPFNGGGGSGAITNHDHSNLPNEGGSLSMSDTLISDTNLYSRILCGA